MTPKRILLIIFCVPLVVTALIAAAGHYKFNILGNDVYFDAALAEPDDLVGNWSVSDDPRDSQMRLFTDGSVHMASDVSTEYGTWSLENGQLMLDIVSDDGPEPLGLDILSWNEAHLILEASGRGEKTLMRLSSDDATPVDLPLSCSDGLGAGSQIIFGRYALQAGDINSLTFDVSEGVPRIDLAVSRTAAIAIGAESVNHIGKPLPVSLDKVVIAAPVAHEEIDSQLIRIYIRQATVPLVLGTLGTNCFSG